MTSMSLGGREMARTPYTAPQSGRVMLQVSSSVPVCATILDDAQVPLVFSRTASSIALGTIVRPLMKFFVVIDNPNEEKAEVEWTLGGDRA